MSNNAIIQGIGIGTGNPRNPGDVRFFVHRVVVRGTNIGFSQESQNEPCFFTVGKQAETDTSALQAKLESLSDEVESLRVQEEAAGNKTRAARAKLKEVDERLKEPQNIEGMIRTLVRRHKDALESLKDLASVEQLEQTVAKKAASLKKKIDTFAQNYAIAVDVQPQVRNFGF
jgi:vacuolar-type H+-ATPase subunit I/STV1